MNRLLRRMAALIFGTLLSATAAADDGIAQLQRFIAQADSADGHFEQVVVSGAARRPQLSSGSFAFERPGRFRWSVETPYPQLLVSDGGRLWIWDEDLNQVTVKVLDDALGSTPAAILAGEGALEEAFELVDEGAAEGLVWVRATPRQADSSFEFMRMGLSGDMLMRMELRDHFGQTTTIDFVSLRLGVQRTPEFFSFVPPEGADVIGD
jgi:outer membrane lipoprotein carrier protein